MCLTSFIKTVLKHLLDGLFCGLQRVFFPVFSVVRAEDDDLSLLASQGSEVRHLDNDWTKELGSSGSQLQDATGNSFTLHQRRRVDQLVLLQISDKKPYR